MSRANRFRKRRLAVAVLLLTSIVGATGIVVRYGARAAARRPAAVSSPAADFNASLEQARGDVQDVVRGHQEAIRKGDFVAALRFDARGFRASTPPADYRKLVESRYKPMRQMRRLHFNRILVDPSRDEALAEMDLETMRGDIFRINMVLVREGNQWRIARVSQPQSARRATFQLQPSAP